jgi:Aldo/keto reductase family
MEYARLGNTGLMVSELCLGCMTFGQEADEETSREIVGRFLDAGGNFLDTADVYSNGVSEEITGKALRDVRDYVVLATKVRFPMGEAPNDVGLSRGGSQQAQRPRPPEGRGPDLRRPRHLSAPRRARDKTRRPQDLGNTLFLLELAHRLRTARRFGPPAGEYGALAQARSETPSAPAMRAQWAQQ